MSDLEALFAAQAEVRRWRAEVENASARRDLALMRQHMAHLLSQHEPVHSLGLDRERLRLALQFVQHGSEPRLMNDLKELLK